MPKPALRETRPVASGAAGARPTARVRLSLEANLRGVVTGLLAFLALSGATTLLVARPGPSVQVLQVAHLGAGLALVLAGALYVVVHVWSTVSPAGAARVMPRGPALAVAALLAYAVGLVIVDPGREARAIANPVLGVGSLATIAFVLVSALRVARGAESRTPAIGAVALLASAMAAVAGIAVALGFMLYNHGYDSPRVAHVVLSLVALVLLAWHVRRARRLAGQQPVRAYPWSAPLVRVALPVALACAAATAGGAALVALQVRPSELDTSLLVPIDADFAQRIPATCTPCHDEPVAGWESSSHRHAANNPVFTGLIRRLAADRGSAAVANCLGCHAPHAPDPRRTELATVLASDGYANGVHCVSCHRTAPGAGHGDGSLVATPLAADPFWFLTDRLALPLASSPPLLHTLVTSRLDLHRAAFSTGPDGARTCLPCHVQTLTAMTEGRTTLAIQDQYDSWAASPFAAAQRDCASCHMPRYVSAGSYLVVDHRLRAASTYAAGIGAGQEGVEEVVAVLRGESILPPPTFEDPERPPAGPLLSLRVTREGGNTLLVTSEGTGRIGHSFPNGPTDLIQVWLALRVADAAGRVVMDVGWDGPAGAPRLGHAFEDADGVPIVDHRLWAIERVHDHGHIPAQGVHEQRIPLPDGLPPGPLRVEAAWRYRRLDPALAAELGESRAWMLPIVDVATFQADGI